MALTPDRYTFKTEALGGEMVVKNGIAELWMLSGDQQLGILSQALVRWEQCNNVTLKSLGIDVNASDLVKPNNLYPSSRLNDRDILAALVTGTLEIYPTEALKGLDRDGINVGIWDGIFEKPGYYYVQGENNDTLVLNPGDSTHISELWNGPKEIQRIRHLNLPRMDRDSSLGDFDGGIIMNPGVAHLFGIWPAIRITNLNAFLETRSNFGRWGQAAAVNSVTAHGGFTGVLTAEGTSFSSKPVVVGTGWVPYQLVFDYIQPGLNRSYLTTFSDEPIKTAEEAARDFKPEMMLPRQMRKQRKVIAFKMGSRGTNYSHVE